MFKTFYKTVRFLGAIPMIMLLTHVLPAVNEAYESDEVGAAALGLWLAVSVTIEILDILSPAISKATQGD